MKNINHNGNIYTLWTDGEITVGETHESTGVRLDTDPSTLTDEQNEIVLLLQEVR